MEMQDQVNIQDQAVTEPIKVDTPVVPEINESEQRYQKEISGLNRRISEMDKLMKEKELAIEENKKSLMKEEERRVYELEQRENEVAAMKQEIVRSSNREKAVKYMTDNGISVDLLNTLSFDNWETVQNSLEVMKSVIDTTKLKVIEEYKTRSGHVPNPDGGNQSGGIVTRDMLKTMSASAIDKAMREGRVQGIGKL
jgi:predicted RNase H-like nuclease (RuvC/YqgF family)